MKRRYEFKARAWQSLSVIALCAAFTLATAGCGDQQFHQPKHTGPCVVTWFDGSTFTLERSNGEVFSMRFYDTHPDLPTGTKLADVLYEDATNRSEYFVKAVLAPGQTLTKRKTNSADCANGCIITGQAWHNFGN